MDTLVGAESPSLSSSEESLSLHCDILADSLFDEKSLLNFFNEQEQRDFKTSVIRNILHDRNYKTLCTLGMSNFGFVSTPLRKECWFELLSRQLRVSQGSGYTTNKGCTREHRDENQVSLDVQRSFTSVTDEGRKEKLRKLLERIIVKILRRYPKLSYYQGYHDVVSVFVIVFIEGHDYDDECNFLSLSGMTSKSDDNHSNGAAEDKSNGVSSSTTDLYENETTSKIGFDEDKLLRCVEAFTLLYLRDFMMDSLDFPIDQLRLIPEFIKKNSKAFYKKLNLDKIEPFFAISSILTVFSHELKPSENEPDSLIFQIFDFVISSQSMVVPLAMYATLIMEKKDTIIEAYNANIDNFENSVDLVHGVIQQVLVPTRCAEKIWKQILEEVRSNPSREHISKYRGLVNRYSTLLTTASGQLHTSYEVEDVIKLLEKEIALNSKRKTSKAHAKLHKTNTMRTFARLFSSRSFPLICKVSIFVGMLAIFMKLYRDGSIKAMLPTLRIYLKKYQCSSFAGLYRGLNYVWLDPLHELLKNPSLPRWASKVSRSISSSKDSDF
ncbi:hypothetical protein HG535_0D05730 [Zygotorulaspora mrakii]|uniref:Rab-GAP TBC domain-containing protein n=1 Tax=Zygotorulaspora mrakii TaxID=42260 RepID=A0A7H9B388_ZYGMR|nr:uncharacterized protein HG535_0D05730 [Zygotorulaspora mrakii]QLG72864.1 hypothetical protein HG535_0D05730 [Zygotorulaspora mrakii]